MVGRMNYLDGDDFSVGSYDEKTGKVVRTIGFIGNTPFFWKGKTSIDKFCGDD